MEINGVECRNIDCPKCDVRFHYSCQEASRHYIMNCPNKKIRATSRQMDLYGDSIKRDENGIGWLEGILLYEILFGGHEDNSIYTGEAESVSKEIFDSSESVLNDTQYDSGSTCFPNDSQYDNSSSSSSSDTSYESSGTSYESSGSSFDNGGSD